MMFAVLNQPAAGSFGEPITPHVPVSAKADVVNSQIHQNMKPSGDRF
jgi:hypothetical protein